jgi:hypothetical protein
MEIKLRESWYKFSQLYRKYKQKIFLFVPLVILILLYSQIMTGMLYSKQLDNYFSILYAKEIDPEGQQRIQEIVSEVQNISDDQEKLDKIGEWETRDFTDYYWERAYTNHTQFEFTPLDSPINRYFYDSNGKIRAVNSPLFGPNIYANDPAWIAYYKTGACGELAYLFANVSNRSGFETRVIGAELRTPSSIPILDRISIFDSVGNHAWVEIKIKDEWWYFDPDTFGQNYKFGKLTQKYGWFNQTKYYTWHPVSQIGRVFVGDTNEDVKNRYILLNSSP